MFDSGRVINTVIKSTRLLILVLHLAHDALACSYQIPQVKTIKLNRVWSVRHIALEVVDRISQTMVNPYVLVNAGHSVGGGSSIAVRPRRSPLIHSPERGFNVANMPLTRSPKSFTYLPRYPFFVIFKRLPTFQRPKLSSTDNEMAGRLFNVGKLIAINCEHAVR